MSFSRNLSSARSRHPVTVTGVDFAACAFAADSTADVFAAVALAAGISAATAPAMGADAAAVFALTCVAAFSAWVSALATSAGRDDWCAPISSAAAMTPIAVSAIETAPIRPFGRVYFFKRVNAFKRGDFFERIDFFKGIDVLLG